MADLILFHAECPDGFCSAWVAWQKWPEARFIPCFHDQPFEEDISGADILIADFSFKPEILRVMADQAAHITLLDHHLTSRDFLAEFSHPKVDLVFDMARSGAGITWDHLNPGAKRPWLVDYIEDRDLFNWKLPKSREVCAWLYPLPFKFEAWDRMLVSGLDQAVEFGEVCWKFQQALIRQIGLSRAVEVVPFLGFQVPVINSSRVLSSDVGNFLVSVAHPAAPFCVVYQKVKGGKWILSFYSREGNGADVRRIAERYGGGGHEHAAGAAVDQLPWVQSGRSPR